MPGLPKNVLSTYQQYKNHTDSIAEWLASTAKRHGYVPAKSKGAAKANAGATGRPTYTVALKDWTVLAEFIAGKNPPIFVPVKLAALLDATISLRQIYSNNISNILEDSVGKQISDDKHAFFLRVLIRVRDVLKPCLPKERVALQRPKTTADLVNMFEHLDVEEPSAAFEQAPDVAPASPNEPIYKAERKDDLQESYFAFYLLLHDFNKLRSEVSTAWARYQAGGQDLVAVSITTNTAVDLARSMTDELKTKFARHGGPIRMLQVYYAAQCVAAGTSQARKARPDDDMNFSMFKVAEAMFWPAYQTLNAFCEVLKVNPTPEMKRGIYGFYQPHTNRDNKSSRDQFKEDKILLLEMLPEFFYYCRTTEPAGSRPPVEDELSSGLRTMFKTKEVTLPLAFAATLFLDIHHTLRDEVDFGFKRLTDATHFVQGEIKEELEFHQGIEMETWPKENDMVLQQFSDTLQFWCHEDQQLSAAKKMGRVNIPERFHLHRKHPWLCGLWKYYAQIRFHELSIAFVNAWGSVMSCAHLYNAVGGGKRPATTWKDLTVVIHLQGESTFFVGDAPDKPDDCLKRFALAMGASARNLAKTTRKKKGLVLSKRGPKGLKELGAVLQTFKTRFSEAGGQTHMRAEDVSKILEQATWECETNERGQVDQVFKDTDATSSKKKPAANLGVAKLLGIMRDIIHAEMIEISYGYLCLHRQCWRLLHAVKDQCRDDLINMYGPDYMVRESELPFIVGYVLSSATNAQGIGEMIKAKKSGVGVTSKVMEDAKSVVEAVIDSGMGGILVERILPEALGVQIDFKIE
ncbi:hypothetical protein BDU57DRAFT_535853 [Ampelomyces quisqualis]|uniref:DUF6604 domain-containing protein n=1 Tax=Ampelomyces quisqualis TaxID=50730 RepID=A0A6A5QW31_AMPQU|nr:hypothetical protein BDU57DRAFT_535853 [Ampelomyces quisqualis]